jgi:hypothetical protein
MMRRPTPEEYVSYFGTYIDLVEGDDFLTSLTDVHATTQAVLAPLTEAQADHRYAPGKWSVKEVIQHVIDGERVFCARALAFARGDTTPLPGFDQDVYAANCRADERPFTEILEEFAAVRAASVALFRSFDESTLDLAGVADGNPLSVRAIGFILPGHELHHRGVLEARYLAG